MPRIAVTFREMLRPGAGGLNDRLREHVLSNLEAAHVEAVQVSRGTLEKAPGWQKISALEGSGYALALTAAGQGVEFPLHPALDLGLRWTIDITINPAMLTTDAPIFWRADSSNNKVLTIEQTLDGYILVSHRDAANGQEELISPQKVVVGETVQLRVQRFFNEFRMFWNTLPSVSRDDLSRTDPTKHVTTPLYVGISTDTDGATPSATSTYLGTIDELRIWREEIEEGQAWAFAEYPYFQDERLALYARFNEDTGPVLDYSRNENDGLVLGAPTRDAANLVIPLSTIVGLHHLRTADGSVERWMIWSNGGLFGKDVT